MKRIGFLLLLCAAGFLCDAAGAVPEATPVPPPSAAARKSAAELEKLAMPIALHPDPLVSIILPASAYPMEIVLAARFVKDTNNISKLDSQPWDENVKAVARFPDLIAKMDADLDWTIGLGQAFLDQRKELMDTIQALRLKAQTAGTLKTTPQQIVTVTNSLVQTVVEQTTVVVTNTVVQIEPANPEVIYVPSYPATVYYPPPVYPYGYGYYGYPYYPYAPLVSFSAGFFLGAAFAGWNHCNWGHGDIDIDIDRNVNIDRGNRPQPKAGDRTGNRGTQGWQPNPDRLRKSGAPSAKTREARGWNNSSFGGNRPSQQPSFGGAASGARPAQRPSGVGGANRPAQQPSFGGGAGGQRPATQPSRSPGISQRPSATQRPASSPSMSRGQSSSAFGGISNGGGSTRNYSNRGSYSRGGGGFSGGGFSGGGRGGGGRGGGGRR